MVPLTLGDKHRLRAFENGVLRCMSKEITENRRLLHKRELFNITSHQILTR